MTAPAHEIVALVVTNILFLPYIIICLFQGIDYIDLAAIAANAGATSTLYHLAQTDVTHYESFEYLQNADHISQTLFLFSIIFLYLQFNIKVRAVFNMVVLFFSLNFTAHLVVGMYSFYAAGLVAFFGFIYRTVFYRGHGRPYGITFIILAGLLAGCALVFFFFNDGVGEGNYWWTHGYVWHISILIAGTLVLLGEVFHTEIQNWIYNKNK